MEGPLIAEIDIVGLYRNEDDDILRSVQSWFIQRLPLCYSHTAECFRLAVLIVATIQLSDQGSADSMCSPLAGMITYSWVLHMRLQRLARPE